MWPKFEKGDPMEGAWWSMLFFMAADFTLRMYVLVLIWIHYKL